MIINLRGTSGSGKTYLARRIIELYPQKTAFRLKGEKRKNPLAYILDGNSKLQPLVVLGHYESICGGCDTISSYDQIFNLIKQFDKSKMNVFYEGLLISGDVKRISELHELGMDVQVIALDTCIDECITSVNERRAARGKLEPLNPKNTIEKHNLMKNCLKKFDEVGIKNSTLSRESAFIFIKELLCKH